MKKWLITLILAALMVVVSACGTSANEKTTDTEETNASTGTEEVNEVEKAIAVVEDNLKFAQEEDLDAYLNTVVAEVQENKRTEMETTFANFDLEYEVLSTNVVIESTATIVLQVEQKTVATDVAEGQEFTDSIATVQYNMNKKDGEWKVYSTEIMDEQPIKE